MFVQIIRDALILADIVNLLREWIAAVSWRKLSNPTVLPLLISTTANPQNGGTSAAETTNSHS